MSVSESDDVTEWRAALNGDDRAFAQLFRRHQGRVYRKAWSLVASRTEAEDITAATFFELWRSRKRVVVVNSSVLPWLLATTTFNALNQRRATKRYQKLIEALPREREADRGLEDATLERIAEARAEKPAVQVLRGLRSEDAALVTLVLIEGYSAQEAAQVLGISSAAARKRLSRLRPQLRHAYASITLIGESNVD